MNNARKECECCGYETFVKQYSVFYLPTDATTTDTWYCDACWASGLSKISRYGHDETAREIARSIGFLANMILNAINKGDAHPS